MKYLTAAIFTTILFTSSCSKSDDDIAQLVQSEPVTITASLHGYKVNPPNSSRATGGFTGSLDLTTNELTYDLWYADMTQAPNLWHIHHASEGKVGPEVMDLGTYCTFSTNRERSGSVKNK